jgi:hypothetical protein
MAGQFCVMARAGAVPMVQVELAEFATAMPQILLPVAVEVLVVEQLVGVK